MKHIIKLACLSVVALTALVSCQREFERVDNPNYDSKTNSVLTDFVFNVVTNPQTKQTSDVVQVSGSFRGISNAKLYAYTEGTANNGKILPIEKDAVEEYDLNVAISNGGLAAGESRRVIEMSLPLQTNTLLFYGIAPKPTLSSTSPADSAAQKAVYGHMDKYNIAKTAGDSEIRLGKRLQNADTVAFNRAEKLIAGIASIIMNTNLKGANHIGFTAADSPDGVSTTYGFTVATADLPEISWADYNRADKMSAVTTTHSWYPLEKKLGEAYKQMTTINTAGGELRAGSAEALMFTMTDLWTVVNEVRCSNPTSMEEAVAKYLAAKIHARLLRYFSATVPADGGAVSGFSFNGGTTIKDNYLSATEIADRPNVAGKNYTGVWMTEADFAYLAGVNMSIFPFNFGLPRGATHLGFDAARQIFYYPKSFNTTGMGGVAEDGDFNANSYYYPAELMYFGNSPIMATDAAKKTSDYAQGSGTAAAQWYDYTTGATATSKWVGWNDQAVKASTQAVAMKYNVNYGTALLKTMVKYGVATLKDNNRAVQAGFNGVDLSDATQAAAFTEQDKDIDVSASSFQLTGIIVGGQPRDLGWDYLPVKVDNKYYQGFVYDSSISEAQQVIPASGTSVPVYTALLDNYRDNATSPMTAGIHNPAAAQDKVYIALEFKNGTGEPFYGNYNMVRKDGYFYLIGELDPASMTGANAVKWAGDDGFDGDPYYVIPPYTAEGASQKQQRVFIQDYMTTVTFSFGVNSLKHAYLTVPDLRSGSVSLGLSVDVSWSTGLNFDNILLGGE